MNTETVLFSRGSRLSDVPANYRGISLLDWRMREIAQQAGERRAKQDRAEAPLSKQPSGGRSK